MYGQVDIQRIDRQIEDLQRLRNSYQNSPQPPINNIINTQQSNQPIFEAKFTTENPADILIQNKTAFIDLKNAKLTIKDVDGDSKEYGIILPKDEKDLKIEILERKLREMEMKFNEYSKPNRAVIEQPKPSEYDNEYVAKPKSKNGFFKSNEQRD